jgi:hypothetical protein
MKISLSCVLMMALFASTSSFVQAALIPFGLQSGVTQAELDTWGWTEIHRSSSIVSVAESPIVTAADQEYLMMGVWDDNANIYAILGAGETSAVTAITSSSYTDVESTNPSNGLNFYRTSTEGAWGFSTNVDTDLHSADRFLSHAPGETSVSKGLSFASKNGSLDAVGYGFNATGSDFTELDNNRYERVFFKANSIPEPTSFVMFGITLLGFSRRRRQI